MPDTTPILALPYPEDADTVNVPRDLQALADRLEVILGDLSAVGVTVPVGTIVATGRSTAPTGWVMCDGAEYPTAGIGSATYAALYAAIGTAYPPAGPPTSGYFAVPDLRGRVPVGVDGTAARLTANDALGQSSGAEKHTLTSTEIPDHYHGIAAWDGAAGVGPSIGLHAGVAGHSSSLGFSTGTPSSGAPTIDGGGDGPHNNMQPYQIVNYIIKL